VEKSEVRLHAFGKACRLVIDNESAAAPELLKICQDEILRLEIKFSSYHPESITSRLNQSAGTGYFVPLDKEAISLFDYVGALWTKSKHIFDPTIQILQHCYSGTGELLATYEQLQKILKLVGWRNLEITDNGAHLASKGMLLNLNSCIRPYVLDSVRKLLQKHNVRHAFIEMGNDVVTIGKQPDGSNWLVGVRIPRGARAAMVRFKVNNMGFAVRGDFEQAIFQNGEQFGRALSPVDGQPIPGLLSVAVIADNCLTACSAASIARLKN